MNYCTQHRLCASGADKQTSAFNLYYASVNRLDKFLNRPGKLLSSSGGQALLVPGLALWLIKNFVSLQQDGQAEVILFPRLTQSRFVIRYRSLRGSLIGRHSTSRLHFFIQLSFYNRRACGWTKFFSSFQIEKLFVSY